MTEQEPLRVNYTDLPNETSYHETEADLSTMEGRIDYFYKLFGCEPPKPEYDPKESRYALITSGLIGWHDREGVSFDWTIVGQVTSPLIAYRVK